ncbi:hypothetical protein F4818DRAFT_169489 [Hypoxylon cercidicola]|nr:hypothetical protein F4818DRAFT_169489 [Hypoxylon cercidicola]
MRGLVQFKTLVWSILAKSSAIMSFPTTVQLSLGKGASHHFDAQIHRLSRWWPTEWVGSGLNTFDELLLVQWDGFILQYAGFLDTLKVNHMCGITVPFCSSLSLLRDPADIYAGGPRHMCLARVGSIG